MRYRVELEELSAFVETLEAFEQRDETIATRVDNQVADLHDSWFGDAASAHLALHDEWKTAATQMREALAELREAARVYDSVRTSAASAVNELASVLNTSAGMAGTDTGAHAWAIQYDPLATSLIEAATAVVQGAGQCYDLLYASGVNHLNPDGQWVINDEAVLAMPPMGAPSFNKPAIPSAEGGHSNVPEWWHTVAAYVQAVVWRPDSGSDRS
jgi:WXG100 family type VII secretion target